MNKIAMEFIVFNEIISQYEKEATCIVVKSSAVKSSSPSGSSSWWQHPCMSVVDVTEDLASGRV